MGEYENITCQMTELQAMLVLCIDEDDPYQDELVSVVRGLREMMVEANMPRALWIPHYESLDPYITNETMTPQQAAELHQLLEAWMTE